MANGGQESSALCGKPVTVYKVGGSLFEWPELFSRLNAFLKSEPTRPLIVPGGGEIADLVRQWDRVHDLGDERSHRLAMAAMSLGGALLAERINGTVIASQADADVVWSENRIPVLDPASILAEQVAAGEVALPASWDATSDTIAAWIAVRWPARLTLIKSTSPAHAAEPFVDILFDATSAALTHVEWVNLRSAERGCLPRTVSASADAVPRRVTSKV